MRTRHHRFTVARPFAGGRILEQTEVLEFARAVNASEIAIVGYRSAVRLSNGQLMSEEADIGKRRADQLATLLQGANLKAPIYKVSWRDESTKASGVDDHMLRRTVVTVRGGDGR